MMSPKDFVLIYVLIFVIGFLAGWAVMLSILHK